MDIYIYIIYMHTYSIYLNAYKYIHTYNIYHYYIYLLISFATKYIHVNSKLDSNLQKDRTVIIPTLKSLMFLLFYF